MTSSCRRCGGDVVQSGSGRPKVYCSSACRRSAEFEIRRVSRAAEAAQARVVATQERLEQMRLGVAGLGQREHYEAVLEAQEAVLGELVGRLDELLVESGQSKQ